MITLRNVSDKSFPATGNALVVRHLVIYQTASDVVLGFIRWAVGHPPKDDPDPIAGVTGWALSLHEAKLQSVTDKWVYAIGGYQFFLTEASISSGAGEAFNLNPTYPTSIAVSISC